MFGLSVGASILSFSVAGLHRETCSSLGLGLPFLRPCADFEGLPLPAASKAISHGPLVLRPAGPSHRSLLAGHPLCGVGASCSHLRVDGASLSTSLLLVGSFPSWGWGDWRPAAAAAGPHRLAAGVASYSGGAAVSLCKLCGRCLSCGSSGCGAAAACCSERRHEY